MSAIVRNIMHTVPTHKVTRGLYSTGEENASLRITRQTPLVTDLLSYVQDDKSSKIEILNQALAKLRTEKGLKLEGVTVKDIVVKENKLTAVVEVTQALDLDPRNRNYDSIRYLRKLIETRLLNSTAKIEQVSFKLNEYLPWSKTAATEDRGIALTLKEESKIKRILE